jgi:hypothetical protein
MIKSISHRARQRSLLYNCVIFDLVYSLCLIQNLLLFALGYSKFILCQDMFAYAPLLLFPSSYPNNHSQILISLSQSDSSKEMSKLPWPSDNRPDQSSLSRGSSKDITLLLNCVSCCWLWVDPQHLTPGKKFQLGYLWSIRCYMPLLLGLAQNREEGDPHHHLARHQPTRLAYRLR